MAVDVHALVDQLDAVDAASFGQDHEARRALLRATRRLHRRLETPFEANVRMNFEEPTLNMALRIADDMGMLSALGSAGSSPKTVEQLAAPTSADQQLVRRVMRHVAAMGVVDEPASDQYQATELSEVLSLKGGMVAPREVANRYMPIFQKAPDFLRSNGYRCPHDSTDTVFQLALGKKGQTFWEWAQEPEHKSYGEEFNRLMQFNASYSVPWPAIYPVDHLLADTDPAGYALVDVGGGTGQDCKEFRKLYPEAQGRVMVQDLPTAMEQATKDPELGAIETRAHNFFEAQPIHGSRIYHMGFVLHDWPDVDARKILTNLKAVMTPGYSRLILSEYVLTETHNDPHLTAIDMCMMSELAALERTDKQWEELLQSVGLRLIGMHGKPGCPKSVIEAELA